jgi:sugar phosphate isomerase/epimerase
MERLSFNQITARGWPFAEAVEGCAAAGLQWIGLWRDKVAEVGVATAARLVREHGLQVSSLCRGGFFTGMGPDGPTDDGIADTIAAIDEAAELGTDVLVLVVGGVADRDLPASRQRVADAVEQLVPVALDRGVRLGLEPLHPMQLTQRSVLSTLPQALAMAEPYPPEAVGVVVDEMHVWWDPTVDESIAQAAGRIVSFQVCDELVPMPDPLMCRTLPGQGPIDHRHLKRCVDATGYTGPIEVEIFNTDLWSRPGPQVLQEVIESYQQHVA